MKPHPITPSRFPKRTWLASAMSALLAASALAVVPQYAQARVFISVNIAPPLLPIYEQPQIPGSGYIWTPGYWAYDYGFGYYWVPGTWIRAPYMGALWTPGYWGWNDNAYDFYPGYWGLSVGYYGGIDYGFGYTGDGYYGGYWNNGGFYYNSTVNNITNVTNITNVYSKPVAVTTTASRLSFNGPSGVTRQPTAAELAVSRQRHTGPISAQIQQQKLASRNVSLRASVNHGTPTILATPRAGMFPRAGATTAAALGGARATSTQLKQPAVTRATTLRTTTAATHQPTMHRAAQTTSHNMHTGPVHTSRESTINTRSIEQHHQPASHSSTHTRSISHDSSGPPMHQSYRAERSAGPRETPVMHSEGPRTNSGPRMEAPRQGSAPRGGDKGDRHPSGGDKPKDHDRGGG